MESQTLFSLVKGNWLAEQECSPPGKINVENTSGYQKKKGLWCSQTSVVKADLGKSDKKESVGKKENALQNYFGWNN